MSELTINSALIEVKPKGFACVKEATNDRPTTFDQAALGLLTDKEHGGFGIPKENVTIGLLNRTKRWLIGLNKGQQDFAKLDESKECGEGWKNVNLSITEDAYFSREDVLLASQEPVAVSENPTLHPMFWGGVAASAAGVATLSAGVFFGYKSSLLYRETRRENEDVAAYNDNAHKQSIYTDLANVSYVAGGILTAAGLALMLTGGLINRAGGSEKQAVNLSFSPILQPDLAGATTKISW